MSETEHRAQHGALLAPTAATIEPALEDQTMSSNGNDKKDDDDKKKKEASRSLTTLEQDVLAKQQARPPSRSLADLEAAVTAKVSAVPPPPPRDNLQSLEEQVLRKVSGERPPSKTAAAANPSTGLRSLEEQVLRKVAAEEPRPPTSLASLEASVIAKTNANPPATSATGLRSLEEEVLRKISPPATTTTAATTHDPPTPFLQDLEEQVVRKAAPTLPESAIFAASPTYDQEPAAAEPAGIQAVLADTVVDAIGVSVIATDEEEEEIVQRKQRKFLLWGGALLVVVVVIVVVVVATTAGGGSPLPPTEAPSMAPSVAPSAAPTSVAFQEWASCFPDDDFEDRNSPQSKALEWMSFTRNSSICVTPKARQRFALASWFYAMGGEDWDICGLDNPDCTSDSAEFGWLSDEDECSWYKLACNEAGLVTFINFGDNIVEERVLTNMVGPFPPQVRYLEAVETVIIPGLEIGGSLDVLIGAWKNLKILQLNDNDLTGVIPASIAEDLPMLEDLNVAGNRLSGKLPGSLGSMTALRRLELEENGFTGPIPVALGSSTSLASIDLAENSLTGSVPPSLFAIPSLRILYLSENLELTGSIPTALSSELQRLRLDDTSIGGFLPEELYDLTNLVELTLEEAGFGGTISERIAQLNETLSQLDLSDNNFVGPLPVGLDALTALERLELDGNPSLTGAVSVAVCGERGETQWDLKVLLVDCTIACDCCGSRPECARV